MKITTLVFQSDCIARAYSKESFSAVYWHFHTCMVRRDSNFPVFSIERFDRFSVSGPFKNPLRFSWYFLSREMPPLVLVKQKMLCWICLNGRQTICYIRILLPNFTGPKCFGWITPPNSQLAISFPKIVASYLFRTYLVRKSRLSRWLPQVDDTECVNFTISIMFPISQKFFNSLRIVRSKKLQALNLNRCPILTLNLS